MIVGGLYCTNPQSISWKKISIEKVGVKQISGWCEPPPPCCSFARHLVGKMVIRCSFARHDTHIPDFHGPIFVFYLLGVKLDRPPCEDFMIFLGGNVFKKFEKSGRVNGNKF